MCELWMASKDLKENGGGLSELLSGRASRVSLRTT